MWSQFILGSNIVENCSGVLIADGRELFYLERGKNDAQLLLSVDVFDASGARLAKLRRNAWPFHQDQYEVTTAPSSLVLTETATGKTLLSAIVHDRDRIEVERGDLYSTAGAHIVVGPDRLVIGAGITLSRNLIRGMNSAFAITKDSFSIGVGRAGPPQELLDDAA
jgi:hypothetical protein